MSAEFGEQLAVIEWHEDRMWLLTGERDWVAFDSCVAAMRAATRYYPDARIDPAPQGDHGARFIVRRRT